MNLNVILSCPITLGAGKQTCSDGKTTIPQYHGIAPGSCVAIEHALSEQHADIAAGLARFMAANLALPSGYTLAAIGNTLAISNSAAAAGAAAKPSPPKPSPAKTNSAKTNSAKTSTAKVNTAKPIPATPDPGPLVGEITAYIDLLNSSQDAVPPVSLRISFPAAAFLGGDAGAALADAAGSNFQLEPLTSTAVLVTANPASAIRTCQEWTDFFSSAGDIAHTAMQASPVDRTYEIDAGDAATALNAAPLVGPGSGPGNGSSSGKSSGNSGISSGAGAGSSGAGSGGSKAASAGGSNAGGSAGNNSTSTPPSAPTPSTTTANTFPLGHPGDDLILFTSANGDRAISEKQRVLAAMDLPRPQMLINGWVLQSSTRDYGKSAEFRNGVTQFVNQQNDALQTAVLTGWNEVAARIRADMPNTPPISRETEQLLSTSNFFDHDFTDYLTQRKAYNPVNEDIPPASATAVDMGGIGATAAQASALFCAEGQYCFGYTELFAHAQPRLTDLLLTFIAAANPQAETKAAIDAVEKNPAPPAGATCEDRDAALLGAGGAAPPLALECFRERANGLLAPGNGALGLIRAALADFLFNYKMSQIYPHEFTAYDLSQSAVSLDRALEPLIDSFNRDIAAFQIFWQKKITDEEKHLIGPKQLFYSGVISVRTVAGNASSASTTSQSFLNISQAPDIGTLLSNLVAAAPAAAVAGTPAGVLAGNLSPNGVQALKAALESYQTTQAQVGRQLSIQAQPRSLAGASAAELDVTFNAGESAPPTYWSSSSGSSSSGPNLSRVSSQSVSTHVRVDSLNLFEISSMTAILRAGRTKFPLLPPFVEIPYIGTLVGIPLKEAENFQTSTAIISAVVVPTASDLANGLRFRSDLVLEPLENASGDQSCQLGGATPACHVRQAASMQELGGRARLVEYNHEMVQCYASGATDCSSLRFNQILAPAP